MASLAQISLDSQPSNSVPSRRLFSPPPFDHPQQAPKPSSHSSRTPEPRRLLPSPDPESEHLPSCSTDHESTHPHPFRHNVCYFPLLSGCPTPLYQRPRPLRDAPSTSASLHTPYPLSPVPVHPSPAAAFRYASPSPRHQPHRPFLPTRPATFARQGPPWPRAWSPLSEMNDRLWFDFDSTQRPAVDAAALPLSAIAFPYKANIVLPPVSAVSFRPPSAPTPHSPRH
ncbi:hypothetical protein FKP32DRAFT_1250878 [Trametes sanguinea]|nr:hypothetical protein FKP32DRAFT_1250878 [Trametes sanguinea]